ncbi:MAG: ribosome small subunit-dependent GTPase A [Bacteroidetes bacterium]|nr:ribosome small subunit-dependent GTPase A [Bacteroidota bacterium]
MELEALGWNASWLRKAADYMNSDLIPFRVLAEHKERYEVLGLGGESMAEVSGRFRFNSERREDFPAVGDWVMANPVEPDYALIQAVLPRQTKLARKDKLKQTEEQILAANVDTVFVVTSANEEFNLRRIERFLVIVRESGALPVVVLNKSDIAVNLPETMVRARSTGHEVVSVSAVRGNGLDALQPWMQTGNTIALIGSSGVGKSTIINSLLETDAQRIQSIRSIGDKGRHTTTHRELFILTNGALLIDTPGIREIQLYGEEDSVEDAFADIAALGADCRFRDCSHDAEPGCAVIAALESGQLDPKRYGNYLKMKKELLYLKRKQDPAAARAEKERWKKIHQNQRAGYKARKKT